MEFDFKLPGLGRPASSRPQRVAEAVRNELSLLLLRDAGDPRLAGVAISRVVVTPDQPDRPEAPAPGGGPVSRDPPTIPRP